MEHAERLLLYADILGWSAEIAHGDMSRCLTAVEKIHDYGAAYNEKARQELIALEGKVIDTDFGPIRVGSINRMRLEIQFGAFSDHLVFSLPASFGSRILTMASTLIRNLLRLGFLTRGAVVLGPLHHQDNIIFGRALLEAVELEERQAFYPRVLVSDAVVGHCSRLPNDPRDRSMITDQTGRIVINPYAMPIDGPDEIINSFMEHNFFFSEIKRLLDDRIDALERERRHNHAEKWRYMQEFISGPVLEAAPKLRRFWQ